MVDWLLDTKQYEHESVANAIRYANIVEDCESAKHEAIRGFNFHKLKGGICMDIAALSMSMSMSNLQTQIGIALMDKAMETAEITTDGIKQMMEASVTPHLGQMIDISL